MDYPVGEDIVIGWFLTVLRVFRGILRILLLILLLAVRLADENVVSVNCGPICRPV